eukprot:COSAG02_NODE_7921_length_2785_cov_1.825763_4_plen_81_part_00
MASSGAVSAGEFADFDEQTLMSASRETGRVRACRVRSRRDPRDDDDATGRTYVSYRGTSTVLTIIATSNVCPSAQVQISS